MLAASAASSFALRRPAPWTQLKPNKLPHLTRLISGQGSSTSFSVRLGPVVFAAVSCRSLRAKATAVATARVRESGMPVVDWWEQLVSAESTLDLLGFVHGQHETIVEFGCGYGTFTIPVAERVHQLYSFDIDHEMVGKTQQRLLSQKPHLENVKLEVRDVVATGYGLDTPVDAVLLMNILHCEAPVQMLQQAADLLKPGGLIYATHWRYDSSTPRGPPMEIRPRPQQLEEWAVQTGLLEVARGPIDCPPWHYGYTFRRKGEE